MRSKGKKNVTPLSAPYSKSVRRFAPLKVGERNKVSGTMGAELRASTSRKASRATTPSASVPSTSAHEMRNERGRADGRVQQASGKKNGADQPKTLRLVPHRDATVRGKRSKTSKIGR